MKTLVILGSTGSIGTQTIEVVRKHGFSVKALAAHSNALLLAEQANELRPDYVCIFRPELEGLLRAALSYQPEILTGMQGLTRLASLDGVDIVVNSVVGMVGLEPTLSAIEHGTDVALANKETLVAGGELVMKAASAHGVNIYPIDSEHSAVFQCLQGNKRSQLNKMILTASGGPFFGYSREQLKNVTVEQALDHPNWNMGKKITIDSATLMNKGLEFIEAMHLFSLRPDQIEIVVHRQSVIHSAVEYKDHSVIAQMGVPDMKIPIQYALLYPERLDCPTKPLSLTDIGTLTFAKPDFETFDCLRACMKAITLGGNIPAAVNGANEEAVAAFLDRRIGFTDIGDIVMRVCEETERREITCLDDVLKADNDARNFARLMIDNINRS